jgi:hypothetical protein
MKKIALLGAVSAALSPAVAFAQTATPIDTGVTSAFAQVTDVISTAGPLLMGVAAAVVVIGVATRMIRKAG